MHSQQDTQCPLSVWVDALIAHVFPSPPLKFRTAGFPQYGFKREVDADLRGENKSTYTTPKSAATNPCGPEGHVIGSAWRTLSSRGPWLTGGYVVRRDQCLLWPHPSHSSPPKRLIFFVRPATMVASGSPI